MDCATTCGAVGRAIPCCTSRPLRIDQESALIEFAPLPFLLWAANDTWLWDSTAFFDTNVYVGYFRHYPEFTTPFTEIYKSSRLPFLLPGVVLYRALSPAAAHHALFGS